MSTRTVPRRAVSTNLNRFEAGLNTNVDKDALFSYILKLSILHYRTEARFRSSETPQDLQIPHSPGHSRRSSYGGVLTSNPGSMPSSSLDKLKTSKSKLPKNSVNMITSRLELQITRPNSKYSPDDLSKRIFGRFYTSFRGQAAETINVSRSPFELLMLFLKEVNKEFQIYYSTTNEPTPNNPGIYAARFNQFLIDLLVDKGYSSSHASLISELEGFKTSFLKGETLAPSKPFSNGHNSRNSISGSLNVENTVKPSFKLPDMAIATFLTSLFGFSPDYVQQMVKQFSNLATEQAAVAELKFFQEELRKNNRHPSYQRLDFSSETAFNTWKTAELGQIDHQINFFVKFKSSLSSTPALRPNGEGNFFTPPDTKSFYHMLLKLCLRFDSHNDSNLILSKDSSELLNKVGNAWRINHITRSLLLLNVSSDFYQRGLFSMQKMSDEVFQLATHQISESNKGQFEPNLWPTCDKTLSYLTMKDIYAYTVGQIIGKLENIFSTPPPKINPLIRFLGQFVIDYSDFDGFPELSPTLEQFEEMEQKIKEVADDKYQDLVSEIPRDHTFSYEHVLHVANVLLDRARLIQKRNKMPLFGKVDVAMIAISTNFKSFSEDCNLMVQYIIQTLQARDETLPLKSLSDLYNTLVETRYIYQQVVSNKAFSFDIESRLEPLVMKQIEVAANVPSTWIENMVTSDKFLLSSMAREDENASRISSSVTDAFTSFNQTISTVSDLGWNNQIHVALFYTQLMKGISNAIVQYSDMVYALFQKDLTQNEDQRPQVYRSRHEKWLNAAMNAVNGGVDFKPYNFLETTCVKLNDIERAQIELDKIESVVDSEQQHSYLARVIRTVPKPKSFFFTIKIVEATDLRACDSNGLSDPYVTLVLDSRKKQIGRTRTIYEDLNPVWNETFEFTLGEASSVWLTVWDENSITDHSVCGRALVPLDPQAFQDFITKEEWIDLKPQGQLRIMITMESEREDIRFYFGKSLRTLMRTESEMIRTIVNKFSAFINYSVSSKNLKSTTNANLGKVVSSWLSKTTKSDDRDVTEPLNPLFDYLNNNFATLHLYLTPTMKNKVMTKTWEVILDALELLLLPPLSGKQCYQTPLTNREKDDLSIWVDTFVKFFNHDGSGIPMEILKGKQYQEFFAGLSNYYDRETDELIRECENEASKSFKKLQQRNYVSVHEQLRRSNTVMAHRNRRALQEEKNKLQDAERESPGLEDIILRILRLKGMHNYVAKRLEQRAKLSRSLAAEAFLRR